MKDFVCFDKYHILPAYPPLSYSVYTLSTLTRKPWQPFPPPNPSPPHKKYIYFPIPFSPVAFFPPNKDIMFFGRGGGRIKEFSLATNTDFLILMVLQPDCVNP